jgi:hypothetical protein
MFYREYCYEFITRRNTFKTFIEQVSTSGNASDFREATGSIVCRGTNSPDCGLSLSFQPDTSLVKLDYNVMARAQKTILVCGLTGRDHTVMI